MEIALPWSAIGATRKAGDAIGLDVHVNDNDGTGREDKLMWSDAADLASGDPRRFGRATLLPTAWAEPGGRRRPHGARERPARGRRDGAAAPAAVPRHPDRRGRDDPAVVRTTTPRRPSTTWSASSGASGSGWRRAPTACPYYLQHQVWKPEHDPRGLGGDQISMALSSWNLLHGYLGDPAVVANMRLHGRLLAGERDDRDGRSVAEPALPLQHRRPLRPLRRRHGGGEGLPPAGQGGSFGAELVVSTRSPASRATWTRRSGSRTPSRAT